MNIDYADVGNLVLGTTGAIAVYVAATGHPTEAVLIGSVGVVAKAFLSAVDNWKFKKIQ